MPEIIGQNPGNDPDKQGQHQGIESRYGYSRIDRAGQIKKQPGIGPLFNPVQTRDQDRNGPEDFRDTDKLDKIDRIAKTVMHNFDGVSSRLYAAGSGEQHQCCKKNGADPVEDRDSFWFHFFLLISFCLKIYHPVYPIFVAELPKVSAKEHVLQWHADSTPS